MTRDEEWGGRIADAISHLDQLETLIFLGGAKALAAKRTTIEDFERDVRRLIEKHRTGASVSVADLPLEWMQPN